MACLHRIASTLVVALAALTGLVSCGGGPHILYGFMDAQGRWVVAPAFVEAQAFAEGRAAAKRDGQWGYIDTAGHWIVEPRYEHARPFSEGLAAVGVDDTWQFIGPTGVTLIAGPFVEAHPFAAGLAAVQVGSAWGFVDHAGALVIPARFAEVADHSEDTFHVACFSEGLCAAREGDRWGYIDRGGAWAIAPRFAEAGTFREGLAAVREHAEAGAGKVGFIDRRGETVIAPRFENSLWFSGGRAIAVLARPAGPTAVMIDTAGRDIAEVGWQPVLDVFDDAGKFLLMIAPDYLAQGLVPATRESRWGFMDRDGKWVIEPAYSLVLPFRDGIAAVAQSDDPAADTLQADRWGLIDMVGRRIVEPQLGGLDLTARGSIPARLHSRWGLLDRDGRWRVPPTYAEDTGWLDIPAMQGSGEGLQRMGVYANHRWIVADRRGRQSPAREFEWLTDVVGVGTLSPARLAFLERGLWGLADEAMKPVVPAQFDEQPQLGDGLIVVSLAGRKGCIDTAGRWIVPAEFSEISDCGRRRALATRGGVRGVWEPGAGWRALPPVPDDAIDNGKDSKWLKQDGRYTLYRDATVIEGVAPVDEVEKRWMTRDGRLDEWLSVIRRGDRWGVLDERGRERLPVRYAEIGAIVNGLYAVRLGEKWGIVEAGGQELFAARFERAQPYNRQVAVFCEAQQCGLVDRAGKVLLTPRYASIEPRSETLATVRINGAPGEAQSVGIIDAAGRVRVEPRYDEVSDFSDYLWVASDAPGTYRLLDRSSGQPIPGAPEIADRPSRLSEGLAAVRMVGADGKRSVGYMDARGRIAIAPRFDVDSSRYESDEAFLNGVALVTLAGRCGAIDRHGRMILAAVYDHCSRLDDGRVIAGVEAPLSAAALAPVAMP